jgi:hypothetical protein
VTGRWERAGAQAPGSAVGLPPVIQRPALPIRARLGLASWVTLLLVRPAWLWRREALALLVLAAAGVLGWGASETLGPSLLGAVVWSLAFPQLVAGVWLTVPVLRRRAGRWWLRARLGRRWDAACRFAGLTTINDRIPRITSIRQVPAGEVLTVRIPKGSIADEIGEVREYLAAHFKIRDVRVGRHLDRAHVARVDLVRRDPFLPRQGEPAALQWPWLDRDRASLWEPVPVGVDELGDPVTVELPERGVLLGGEPGSGKSAGLSDLLGAATLDPHVHIWGLDAKRLELGLWRPVMERVGFGNMDEAISIVEDLITLMDTRYEELEAAGVRKITDAWPLYVLAIDELRFYTAHHDRRARTHFNALLIDLAARGRAAGVLPWLATQKPSTDVVPSSLRDLIAIRWAMRSTTRDASDTILGAGYATLGYSAADIDPRTRGVGWLLHEGETPRRVRSYLLSDDHIRAIAARGAALRDGSATT